FTLGKGKGQKKSLLHVPPSSTEHLPEKVPQTPQKRKTIGEPATNLPSSDNQESSNPLLRKISDLKSMKSLDIQWNIAMKEITFMVPNYDIKVRVGETLDKERGYSSLKEIQIYTSKTAQPNESLIVFKASAAYPEYKAKPAILQIECLYDRHLRPRMTIFIHWCMSLKVEVTRFDDLHLANMNSSTIYLVHEVRPFRRYLKEPKKIITFKIPEMESSPRDVVDKSNRSDSARNDTANLDISDSTILFNYPFNEIGGVTVTMGDLNRVKRNEMLNDNVIEFFLRYIYAKTVEKDPLLASKVHIFSPFFYSLAIDTENSKNAKSKIKRWNTDINIFEKQFIFIPINKGLHWVLALIYNPSFLFVKHSKVSKESGEVDKTCFESIPWIFIFDSMAKKNHMKIHHQLEAYLKTEANLKYSCEATNKVYKKKVMTPKQVNSVDCGVYLLSYVQKILENPVQSYNACQARKPKPNAWPGSAEINTLRRQIEISITTVSKA
ncbi:hypothetical protein K7432_012884, partial [Basidiobolus ranarum]